MIAAAIPLIFPIHASAKEYLLVGTKPNLLFLVDPHARKVVREYQIPKDGAPFAISTSPDGKIAYVLTERSGAISGIDLDSGKEVFRAELAQKREITKCVGGMTLSRDGKELFVMESIAKTLPTEYQVQPPQIAVYRTDAGLTANPVRTFAAPRRTATLVPSTDGKIIYGLGWDLYAFDAASGKLLSTQKFFHWDRPHTSPPDLLNFWPMYEQSEIYAAPYFYSKTDLPQDSPEAQKTGLFMLDLKTGKMRLVDFENTSAIIFSSVVNPRNPQQVLGVYLTLSRIDVGDKPKLEKRVFLDHSYYVINVSDDGSECYLGGTMNDIAVYSTKTMEKLGAIKLPGGGDMGMSLMRVVHRQ